MMLRLLAALLAIPLGLDLYLPVPEDNPRLCTRRSTATVITTGLDRELLGRCQQC